MNIWMLVYNNFTTDQRVLKEATTLSQGGHRVTVGNARGDAWTLQSSMKFRF